MFLVGEIGVRPVMILDSAELVALKFEDFGVSIGSSLVLEKSILISEFGLFVLLKGLPLTLILHLILTSLQKFSCE